MEIPLITKYVVSAVRWDFIRNQTCLLNEKMKTHLNIIITFLTT